MKTTEVFVEQMIIGGLVLVTGYILFPLEVHYCLRHFQSTPAQISIGVLLAGAAYLIGTVYDRVTDTMFQDLEKHCRLNYALNGIKSERELETDPYPETLYRMAVLSNDTPAQREDYFRRRLRLTRAFATLIPGMSAAVILYISTCYTGEPWYLFKTAIIPLAYLMAFFYKNLDWKFIKNRRPPKTDDEELVKKYWKNPYKFKREERQKKRWELLRKIFTAIAWCVKHCWNKLFKRKERQKKRWELLRTIFTAITRCVKHCWNKLFKKKKGKLWRFIIADFACMILLLTLLVFGIVQMIQSGYYKDIAIVMSTGIILTILVTWTWWRIYRTYFAFVKDYYISIKGDEIKIKSSTSLSAEVRWFNDGDIPEDIEKWFIKDKFKDKSKERTDIYLINKRTDFSGVKFRKNKFEIKTLVKEPDLINFNPNVEGHVGIWEKWSTKDELFKTFKRKIVKGEADWVAVKKKRVTRKFNIENSSITEDETGKKLDNGCNVELTKIEINEEKYWTLAFDSFSGDQVSEKDDLSELENNLVRTVNKLFSEPDCPFTNKGSDLFNLLTEKNSQSYPHFLAQLRKQKLC